MTESRPWDVAIVCKLESEDSAASHFKPFLIDFHHRACALHLVCAYHYRTQQRLPGWFKSFAMIKVDFRDSMTEADAMATGLTMAASMETGVIHLCWHEQAILMQEKGGAFAKKMQASLGPEYNRVSILDSACQDCPFSVQ